MSEISIINLTPEQINRELEKLRSEVDQNCKSSGNAPPSPNESNSARHNSSPASNDTTKDSTSYSSTPGNTIASEETHEEREAHGRLSESDPQTLPYDNPESFYYNPPKSKYTPLAFSDPVEMLYWLDDNIANGEIILHNWQIEEMLRICDSRYNKSSFLKYHLCACNGSGKDAYINAVVAMFLTVSKIRHRTIITSASFKQLSTQTEAYIRNMATRFTARMDEEGVPNFFKIKEGFIVCNETGSEIKMFVTDEAGKAEGDHPFPDHPNAEMAIIINEAKSVPPDIFFALRRCTGFNRWIEVSSPGTDEGDFYNNCMAAVAYPLQQEDRKPYFRRVNCYECSHISAMEIEDAKRSLTTAQFNSIYLALFTSLNELVMIKPEQLEALKEYSIEWIKDGYKTGGLDLSLGGDETVLVTRDGNKALTIDTVRIGEAPNLVEFLDDLFKRRELTLKSTKIFTDVGGLGKPIAQYLMQRGWNIIPVQNNETAINNRLYRNRGAEDWARVADIVTNKHLIIPFEDKKLIHQLGHRYYEFVDDLKIKLEEKKKAKERGVNSPDRADAFVLAFANYSPRREAKVEIKARLTQNDFIQQMDKMRFQNVFKRTTDNRLYNKISKYSSPAVKLLAEHFVKEKE